MILDWGFAILDSVRPARFSGNNATIRCGPTIQNPKSKIQNALGLFLCASVTVGCQTQRVTTSDGWPLPPEPRQAPVPPSSARADRMVFTVGSKPDDTNNNGFPDTIRASVALFSTQHPTALRQEGMFVFALYPQGKVGMPDAQPIATWRIDPKSRQVILTNTLAGPSYLFNLSLLEAAGVTGDRLPLDRADLICSFEASDGSPTVKSEGVRTIQIGSRLAAR
jgi:hypothetical protein